MAVWKFFGDNYSDNAERVAKQRWNEFMKKNLTKAIVLSVLTMGALGMTSSVSAAEMGFKEFIGSYPPVGNKVTVDEDTVVNADPIGTGDVAWKVLAISPYTINVAKGAELVLNDLITYDAKIIGEGDIVINKTELSNTYGGAYPAGLVIPHNEITYIDGIDQNVLIKGNSLTIDVTTDGNWASKGIMVASQGGGNIQIDLTGDLLIKSNDSCYLVDRGVRETTPTSTNIEARNVTMIAKSNYVIKNETAGTLNIEAEKNISLKGGNGVSNNSNGKVDITAKNGDVNIESRVYYGLVALGSGGISVSGENNTITVGSVDNGCTDRGIRNSNGRVVLTATKGNNTVYGAEYGAYASGKEEIQILAANGANNIEGEVEAALYSHNGLVTASAIDNNIKSDKNAMYAHGGRINVESTGTTKMIGDVVADEYAKRAGYAKAGFDSEKSYLLGAVHTDGGWTDNSKTDLSFTNGATWYLTDNSNVSDLTLDNGIVDLTEQVKNNEKVNAYKVSIDRNLNGSGLFKLDLTYLDNNVERYMRDDNSDFIYIYGGDNSEQNIEFAINDANLGAMKSGDKLYFAQVHNDGATFGQGETIRKANEDSIYDNQYRIESEEHKEVAQLSLDDRAASNPDGIDEEKPTGPSEPEIVPMYSDWYITCEKGDINPNGETPVQSYNAGFALWRDDDTLLKRLGELRYTNDEGGVWTRVIGKKLEDNRALGFNTHAKTVQVGYDRKDVQEDGSGTWRKGIAIGHTWADTSFSGGEGKNNYTDLSIYATNIRKHDHYLDLVARFGRINSDYDTVYGDHGEFDNWAGSLSAEYGRKKQMNEDNWFIEPQAQLTYSYMWGDSYTTRKGVRVEQDNADSLVGRAGFIISKELESERKYPNRYYAKAFIMHEFMDGGDNTVSLGSDRFYAGSDFKDTWYVVGVGANADMGNQCTFYFDAEKNFKAHVKMPYRIEAGFRWEF